VGMGKAMERGGLLLSRRKWMCTGKFSYQTPPNTHSVAHFLHAWGTPRSRSAITATALAEGGSTISAAIPIGRIEGTLVHRQVFRHVNLVLSNARHE
jgi:hypothetical protein